jgi:hypothetical protein
MPPSLHVSGIKMGTHPHQVRRTDGGTHLLLQMRSWRAQRQRASCHRGRKQQSLALRTWHTHSVRTNSPRSLSSLSSFSTGRVTATDGVTATLAASLTGVGAVMDGYLLAERVSVFSTSTNAARSALAGDARSRTRFLHVGPCIVSIIRKGIISSSRSSTVVVVVVVVVDSSTVTRRPQRGAAHRRLCHRSARHGLCGTRVRCAVTHSSGPFIRSVCSSILSEQGRPERSSIASPICWTRKRPVRRR